MDNKISKSEKIANLMISSGLTDDRHLVIDASVMTRQTKKQIVSGAVKAAFSAMLVGSYKTAAPVWCGLGIKDESLLILRSDLFMGWFSVKTSLKPKDLQNAIAIPLNDIIDASFDKNIYLLVLANGQMLEISKMKGCDDAKFATFMQTLIGNFI